MEGFEALTQYCPLELRGHRDAVAFVLWIQSKQLLATAGDDKSVRIWDVTTRKAVKSFYRCFEDDIDALYHFSAFDSLLFATSGSKIVVLNLSSSLLIDTTPLAVISLPCEVSSLAVSLDHTKLIVGDEEGTIHFLLITSNGDSLSTEHMFKVENAHTSIVSNLLLYERAGKNFMVSSSYDCSCALWEIKEEEASLIARVDFANLGTIQGQMFNPPFVHSTIEVDEDFFLVGLGDGSVRVVRKQDLFVSESQEFHNHQTIQIRRVGDEYFSAGLDGTLQVFSATRTTKKEKGKTKTRVQLQPRRSFKHPSKVNCATVIELEDGNKKIAVADVGSVVYLYDYAF